MKFYKHLLSTCILIFISSLSFADTFNFTAIPDEDSARLVERFNKVATYLSGQLKVNVNYIPVKSYSASVTAFKNNQVQLAWFGGLSGVKARRAVPGSKAIAQGVEDQAFVTYFIANTRTNLTYSDNFPEGLKGKTFTFGSKGSTSGRLMPEFYIRDRFKSAPRSVFRRVGFSGNHSKTIALVQAGSYEAGAVNYKVWENELKAGKIDISKIQIIWKTPRYVDYNWSIRGDVEKKFGAGFIKKVQNVLIRMTDRKLLDSFPRKAFIAANNKMYRPILETGVSIGIFEN